MEATGSVYRGCSHRLRKDEGVEVEAAKGLLKPRIIGVEELVAALQVEVA